MTKRPDDTAPAMTELTSKNRNDRFIAQYKLLEAFANQKFNKTGKYMPMSQLTDMILAQLPGARDFATDFELFNNLRNMIQHKAANRYFIIQPEVVTRIKHVYDVLTRPITVGELFSSEVIFVNESDQFAAVMRKVREHHHTQFPVVRTDGMLMRRVVTANAMAHALSVSQAPTVSEMIQHTESVVFFIQSSASIFTAEKMMLDEMRTGKKSVVLLLTNVTDFKKVRPADVLGLINIADLPQILSKK